MKIPGMILVVVVVVMLPGCAAYRDSNVTPYNMTLGTSMDERGRNASPFVSFDWDLKPKK